MFGDRKTVHVLFVQSCSACLTGVYKLPGDINEKLTINNVSCALLHTVCTSQGREREVQTKRLKLVTVKMS